jgi:hypothetical protein
MSRKVSRGLISGRVPLTGGGEASYLTGPNLVLDDAMTSSPG